MNNTLKNIKKAVSLVQKANSIYKKKSNRQNKKTINKKSKPGSFFYHTQNSINLDNAVMLSIVVYPNNVFGSFNRIEFVKNNVESGVTISKNVSVILHKKAKDYKISYTKKGAKPKAISFISQYLSEINSLKRVHYDFIGVSISAPINLRRSILYFLFKLYLNKFKYKNKKNIFINIKDSKVFNGCDAAKRVKRKRKRFRLKK